MVDVAGVDASGLQRVALQVQRLGAVRLRDAGVADRSACVVNGRLGERLAQHRTEIQAS